MSRYRDWLRQAENDLEWVHHSFSGGFFSQTCFIAQQAAEKALKALCFRRGFDVVKTHSLFPIVRSLEEDGELEQNARELDLYYIAGRYPDAFPSGAPFEVLTRDQARQALGAAEAVVAQVAGMVDEE